MEVNDLFEELLAISEGIFKGSKDKQTDSTIRGALIPLVYFIAVAIIIYVGVSIMWISKQTQKNIYEAINVIV